MTAYSEFVTDVSLYIPMCPSPVIQQAVKEAAITFGQLSEAMFEVTEILTISGVAVYDIPVSEGVTPLRIQQLYTVDGKLEPTSVDLLLQDHASLGIGGRPAAYYQDRTDQVTLFPVPTAPELMTVKVVVKPKRNSTAISDHLAEAHWETIMSGAVSRLASMKNSEWFDPDMAAQHAAAFRAGVETARRLARNIDKNKRRSVKYGGY